MNRVYGDAAPHTPSAKSAFSLIELSIVLVIIGLLLGGVLAGQSLIKSAELRKLMSDLDRYKTATYTFRDKYNTLPGDMSNATQFWGAADADRNTCKDTDSSTLADPKNTCNGDGDGMIEQTSAVSWYVESYESFRYWQHLANAGLIEGGRYTGVSCCGSPMQFGTLPGGNSPKVPIANAGMMINYYPEGSEPINVTSFETVFYGQSFVIGSTDNSNFVPTTGFMAASDVYLVDLKMDDGKPASGYILPTVALWGVCVTDTSGGWSSLTDVNAIYASNDSSRTCGIVFRNII